MRFAGKFPTLAEVNPYSSVLLGEESRKTTKRTNAFGKKAAKHSKNNMELFLKVAYNVGG